KRALADGGRGRRACGPNGHDGSAEPGAAGAAWGTSTADGLVVDEGTVEDGESPCVEDAAAEGVHARAHAWEANDLVVRHDGIREGQGAGIQDAAAPQKAVPVGDGQVFDARRYTEADLEDPADVAAADG